jgi:GT2 family glycosyltransferase
MDLSTIIVSWNVKEKLRENLRALFRSKGDLNFEIFVIDNNSKDGSAEMVKNEFPSVRLIANNDNLGFAKANNQAIKQTKGDFILLLNPDMKVFPDTLVNMVNWMRENNKASVAGCYLVDENGNTVKHVRKFPRLSDQFAITLKLPHIFSGVINDYLRSDFDYSKPAKVDSIRGGFFMIRRETIEKVGLLDERYFLWFEEVDFCRRVKNKGGQVWYTPSAKCVDYVGQSFSQVKRGKTQKYFRDSMLKYFKKWHTGLEYWILRIVWPIGIIIAWIGEKLKIKSRTRT